MRDALRSVMDRQSCNMVMGCLAEEELIAAGAIASKAIMDFYPQVTRESYNKFHLIDLLGETGDKGAVPFLQALLKAPQWNARANAALALGLIGDHSVGPALLESFEKAKSSNDMAFAYALAFALERMGLGNGQGKRTLLLALDAAQMGSVNWGYTRYAVQAVGLLGVKEACPKLVPSLLHKDVFLRKEALRSVARLGCKDLAVLDATASSLDHTALGVRSEAADTLRTVTKVPIRTLKTWQQYRKKRSKSGMMKIMPLSWLMVLSLASFVARAQECPLEPLPPLVTTTFQSPGLSVGLPGSWKQTAQVFAAGVQVADSVSGCRLEVSRVTEMSSTDVMALHERLYWGSNGLSEACQASLAARAGSNFGRTYVGQYEPRQFGYKLLVVVRDSASASTELVTLRCPRNKAGWLNWSWAVAILDSLVWGPVTLFDPNFDKCIAL